jgi:hypothetical protein
MAQLIDCSKFLQKQTHVDQTYWAAIERVRLHFGNDAAQRVLDGSARAIICNVWRPLSGPVSDLPLAVADFRSLDDQRDFGETLPAPPGCRTGESQMLRFHPDQKWYYLSGMQPHECLFLKCFDSLTGVRSPHSVCVSVICRFCSWMYISVDIRHSSTQVHHVMQVPALVWRFAQSV